MKYFKQIYSSQIKSTPFVNNLRKKKLPDHLSVDSDKKAKGKSKYPIGLKTSTESIKDKALTT